MRIHTFTIRRARSTTPMAERIAGLDPEVSYEEIARLLYAWGFPWDIERSLELALFRTYAVPSISGLLASTGEFEHRARKRYDDTELILAEAIENGLDSERGRRSIARMNAMHGRFEIRNADMLYVLSTFVCEPIRWLERFGRRPMTEREMRGWFLYYRGLGERMGIEGIPAELAELTRMNVDYETTGFCYANSNNRVAGFARDMLLAFYVPRRLVPIARPVLHALLDRPLLQSMGFRPAPEWLVRSVTLTMHVRARILRRLAPRRTPRFLTEVPRPTYPEGYRIEELGTFENAPGRSDER